MQSTLPELTQLVAEARRYQPAPVPAGARSRLTLDRHRVPVDDLNALLRTHDDLPWHVNASGSALWAELKIAGPDDARVDLVLFADYADREGKTLPELGES